MAQVSSPHIWYPVGYPGVAYDLRLITSWWVDADDINVLYARVNGATVPSLRFVASAFISAKQNSLANGG